MKKDESISAILLSFIKNNWFSFYGLLASWVLSLFILLPYFWNNFEKGWNSWELTAILFCNVAIYFFWVANRKIPNSAKGKTGIAVAIVTENKYMYVKLKTDLILKLNEAIRTREKESRFDIKLIPEYYSAKIVRDDCAQKFFKKSNYSFLIYGTCGYRIENTKKYFISLEAMVKHSLVTSSLSHMFSVEFRELFPRKIIFESNKEISGFETTKQRIGIASSYIIGIAAFLSYDFDLSFKLFEEIYITLKQPEIEFNEVRKIKNRVTEWLIVSALNILDIKYHRYREEKNKRFLLEMEPFLNLLNTVDPDNYSAHVIRGIYYFLIEKNIDKAKYEISQTKNNKDIVYRYNKAFLYAYEGRVALADKFYERAFRYNIDFDRLFQIEGFIYDVLENEASKYQLWYCIGLINFKIKGDSILAKQAFENFLNYSDNNIFPEQTIRAKKYLEELTDNKP